MDKAQLKINIETAFDNFKKAIQKKSDINKRRADGGWSVGEIANHIIKGTKVNLEKGQQTDRPFDQNADTIRATFLNYNFKFPAASFLQPDPKKYTLKELVASLDNNKNSILEMIDKEDLAETCNIAVPVWGYLTRYEWLVLFESHIIRHTRQVNDFDTVTA